MEVTAPASRSGDSRRRATAMDISSRSAMPDPAQPTLPFNRHRSIIVAKGRRYWVYAYLFAKQDRANIEADELKAFRKLADLYAAKTDVEIGKELKTKELVEICK
jgi:RelE toxin of RelE / RelB toxin-antitoxin system